MKRILFFLFSLLVFSVSSFAESSWINCSFPGYLDFAFPSTLKALPVSYNQVVTDLQTYDGKSFKTFNLRLRPSDSKDDGTCLVNVRLMAGRKSSTSFGQPMQWSKQHLDEFQGEYLLSASKDLNTQLVLANPAEIFSVDGKSCIYLEYHYTLPNQPEWYAYLYQFNDGDRRYRVVMHVRSDKYPYWTAKPNDIRDIVRTLVPVHR